MQDLRDFRVTEYLEYLEDVKPFAAKAYFSLIKRYAEFIGKSVEDLTLFDFTKARVERLIKRIKNPHTANTLVKVCHGIASYVEDNYIDLPSEQYHKKESICKALKKIEYREVPEEARREALSEEKLEELLSVISDDLVYSATVVHFYFGARPVELSQPYVEARINFEDSRETVDKYGRRVVDWDQKLICIPVAKSELRYRILPVHDLVIPHLKLWMDNLEDISTYGGRRGEEWFTKHIKPYSKKIGFNVTARTARKTFETIMTKKGLNQWMINFWLGHKGKVPDIYKDKTMLMEDLKKEVWARHPVLRILS